MAAGSSGGKALLRSSPASWPLSAKIILALALSLLPLGVLAFVAAVENYRSLRTNQINLAATRIGALEQQVETGLREIFTSMRTVLLIDSPHTLLASSCRGSLTRLSNYDTRIRDIARLSATGAVLCQSAGSRQPSPSVVRAVRSMAVQSSARFPQTVVLERTRGKNELVLITRDNSANSNGDTIMAWLSGDALEGLLTRRDVPPRLAVRLLYDQHVLAEWGRSADRALAGRVRDRVLLKEDRVADEIVGEDDSWLRTRSPLYLPHLQLDVIAPMQQLTTIQALSIATPALMWLTALVIGWITIDRIVVRPLGRMRRLVERYGGGERSVRLGGTNFYSQEIGELGTSFDRMADQIDSHENELADALKMQRRLTREVHHRVKNNLQIVSSLLSLQSRETSSPETTHVYAAIQQRVNALALVHRWLYDDESMRGVDLRSLSQDLCASLEATLESMERIHVRLLTDVGRVLVGQDYAVPLAFLITELVTAAARQGVYDTLAVRVSARSEGERATLSIEADPFRRNDLFAPAGKDASTRIVQGLARQLRTKLEFEPEPGRYSISFPIVSTQARLRPRASEAAAGG